MTEFNEEVELDLFGEPIISKGVKIPPAAKKPEPTASVKTAATPAPVKKAKKETYGIDYQYAYAGHIGNLPQENMSLESIRQYLQVDFPELSKARTKIEVDDEEKLIVPIVKGAKSG